MSGVWDVGGADSLVLLPSEPTPDLAQAGSSVTFFPEALAHQGSVTACA